MLFSLDIDLVYYIQYLLTSEYVIIHTWFVLIITNSICCIYSTDILVVTPSIYIITMDLHNIMFEVHCIVFLDILCTLYTSQYRSISTEINY